MIPHVKKFWKTVEDNKWLNKNNEIEVRAGFTANKKGQFVTIDVKTNKALLKPISEKLLGKLAKQGFLKKLKRCKKL